MLQETDNKILNIIQDIPQIWPVEPNFLHKSEFEELLVWAYQNECSGIILRTDDVIFVRQQGIWKRVGLRELSTEEIMTLLGEIHSVSDRTDIKAGIPPDFAHEIKIGRGDSVRFRFAATGIQSGYSTEQGISLTARPIPSIPPKWSDMQVHKGLNDAFFPPVGMVLVTGATGSGKTTLLNGGLAYELQNQPSHVITFEQPIEFNLMRLKNRLGLYEASEVPRDITEFINCMKNALRREPDVIMIGESREPQTIEGLVLAAQTGHRVYSTVHTNNIETTPARMVDVMPHEVRSGSIIKIIDSCRLIVHQRLIKGVDGKRVAIQSHLPLSEKLRAELIDHAMDSEAALITNMRKATSQYGETLLQCTERLYAQGRVDKHQYNLIEKEFEMES